ncbi:MAG: DNA polymerase III subunit beta, partial [Acidobacteriota bacterium]|nr:DNA polymerase III subunit beta [Acidobacteriota bacterium]
LEVTLRSRAEAAVSKHGSVTLPAKKLYEVVRALPDGDVHIATEKSGSGVTVSGGQFTSRMPTLPREDFPTVNDAPGTATSVIKGSTLAQMIAKTQFAITGEDTRYYLNGALFVLRPDQMTFVATDGHRLALVHADREGGGTGEEVKAILPRKALAELGRLLADSNGDVRYERGENHLFFEIGPRLLVSRMIDGQFPAYEKVVPKSNDKHIEFERDRLTSAVRRVALLSNERSRAVKFVIDKGRAEVTSSSPEFGEAREPIEIDYAGPEITICFNAQYVIDFLNAVESDVVSLDLKDDVSQAVMKPVGVDGYDYTYVIMPMRL